MTRTTRPLDVWLSLPLAALVAWSALGGLLFPSIYARETASWTAQGQGQDWVNLLLLAPVFAVCGLQALAGSRRARLVLGGALAFSVYTFLLYALELHFNRLFLVYCATLGLSFFGLLGLLRDLALADPGTWYRGRVPARTTGIYLLLVAGAFALTWLSQVIPALLDNRDPEGLREVGLVTNPVHVLDLSVMLPTLAATGLSLLRGRALGLLLAPLMLGFIVLMSLSMAVMVLLMQMRGIGEGVGLAITSAGLAVVALALLGGFLSQVSPEDAPP